MISIFCCGRLIALVVAPFCVLFVGIPGVPFLNFVSCVVVFVVSCAVVVIVVVLIFGLCRCRFLREPFVFFARPFCLEMNPCYRKEGEEFSDFNPVVFILFVLDRIFDYTRIYNRDMYTRKGLFQDL